MQRHELYALYPPMKRMNVCCPECFADEFIQAFVREDGKSGDCDYCDSEDVPVVAVSKVGEFIRAGLRKAYVNIDDDPGYHWDSEDHCYIDGQDVSEVLNDEEQILSESVYHTGKDQILLHDLMEESGPSHHDIAQGSSDDLDGLLVIKGDSTGADDNRFTISWQAFCVHVKHYARFFDVGEEQSRSGLLEPIQGLLRQLTVEWAAGQEVWRARRAEGEFPHDAQERARCLGPPPLNRAKQNRMSPSGIPYLYVGDSADLCLAEIRPFVGDRVWVGRFRLRKSLRVIELAERLSTVRKSVFDPEYDHNERWLNHFMDQFRADVARPVLPEKESLEYAATQVLSEYIRDQRYDGIRFGSSQFQKGFNAVLFCGPKVEEDVSPCRIGSPPSLPPFDEWLEFVEAKEVDVVGVKFETRNG